MFFSGARAKMLRGYYALEEELRLRQRSLLLVRIPAEHMRVYIFVSSCGEAYKANALSQGSRKGKKDIDCWIEPP